MNENFLASAAVAMALLASAPVSAQLKGDTAPDSVAVFYDALNAAPGKDVPKLLMQATAPNWVSCGGNDACGTREQVIAAREQLAALSEPPLELS